MKLTRREILLSFATTLTVGSFQNGLKQVRAQSITPPNSLPENPLDKEQLYNAFIKTAEGGQEDYPVLLQQGIKTSPYEKEIKYYPSRLKRKPDVNNLVTATQANNTFSSYPAVGELPIIDAQGLSFLHEEITEACICVGSFSAGNFQTKWLGRNALSRQQFWSATKIIPFLHLISQINKKDSRTNIDVYRIQGIAEDGREKSFPLYNLARDMFSYEKKIASSNSLGAMFKRFFFQVELEDWLKSITDNKDLVFQGDYGEKPFIDQPNVVNYNTNEIIIPADLGDPKWGSNEISAYDLNRMISMVGWHNYLSKEARLPYVQSQILESVVSVMGTDSARLTDLAIKALGLQNDLDGVVILSKEGNGASEPRKRTEAVYVALVQMIDLRPQKSRKPAKLITLSMALRGAKSLNPRNLDREVVELDARMATEVTEILARSIKGELA